MKNKTSLIKIVLKNNKRFTFREDSLICHNLDKKRIPLEQQLNQYKFIRFFEEKEYGINTNEIKYYIIYKGKLK